MNLSPFDLGSIVAIVSLVVTVAKIYLDQRKTKKELELSKRYLKILSQSFQAYVKTREREQDLEKQKFQWQKLKDIGKALWEYSKPEDVDYDY